MLSIDSLDVVFQSEEMNVVDERHVMLVDLYFFLHSLVADILAKTLATKRQQLSTS